MFSKRRSDCVCHLKKIFESCSKYGISLSPKKNIFGVLEGTLLQHMIAKSRIKVDPEKFKAITQSLFLMNKKTMQYFLGKINFLRNLISNYAHIVKYLKDMINKDATYKWDKREKDSFAQTEQAIANTPTLFSPNYEKYFMFYTFSLD